MHVNATPIPLYKPHFPVGVDDVVKRACESGLVANGPSVAAFEMAFGKFIGNSNVVANSDVSLGLTLCLFAAGVRPGDEVIMSPIVCLSTSCPVRNLFASIRWCDVDPRTGNLDPDALTRCISKRTKAIVLYHWAGYPSALSDVHRVARSYGIPVIEDASESLGARYSGRMIGGCGSDYTVFSFYPNRQLSTLEGGAISLSEEQRCDTLRRLRRYGINYATFRDNMGEISAQSDIEVAGWNSYLSNVAASIGLLQLKELPHRIDSWKRNGVYYDAAFANVRGVEPLSRPDSCEPCFWVYTLRVSNRDSMLVRLRAAGIHASKVHLRNDIYTAMGRSDYSLPGVDDFAAHTLSVPCGPWVNEEDRDRIVSAVSRSASY